MWNQLWKCTQNVHDLFEPHWAGIVLILVSCLCGSVIGLERRAKNKPAGMRTLILITMGSTIFTMASILMARNQSDPGRIAAQIVTGVGFLGAGAIIRDRGSIVGLTTGATIWTSAAIGLLIGAGYAAAAVVLTGLVLGTLTIARGFERMLVSSCRKATCRLAYERRGGLNRVRILTILDDFGIADRDFKHEDRGDLETMTLRYCHYHRNHRAILSRLLQIEGLREIQIGETEREIEPELEGA